MKEKQQHFERTTKDSIYSLTTHHFALLYETYKQTGERRNKTHVYDCSMRMQAGMTRRIEDALQLRLCLVATSFKDL